MRPLTCVVAVLAFVSAAYESAQAQQPGITYDCDTATDSFSELVLPAPGLAFSVIGRVRLNKIASINKYAPLTRVQISSPPARPGQTPEQAIGFELSALPAKSLKIKGVSNRSIVQFITWDERIDGKTKSHDLLGPVEYSDSLSFSITYDGSNVAIKIGSQETKIPLIEKTPVVRLICSTGEFLYTDLRIEKAP